MRTLTPIALLSLAMILPLRSQSSSFASQTLSLEVRSVSTLTVSGSPSPMVISNADAGNNELRADDRNTSYSITTNRTNMKLAVSLNTPMPTGTRLLISMLSSKGQSRGAIDISNALAPLDAVTGIGRGSDAGQEIAYTLIADASVGPVPSQTRIITLTLTD